MSSTTLAADPALHVERHRLANGLEVVLHRDTSLPLVTINLWYHVGSKNERPGRTGFAHLFEHMLFQGSEHVGTNDHFRYIQQVGGLVNGSTWYDRTNYYETLPSHYLSLGLWLESDRMGFLLPALSSDKLENQRSVVMNERRQRIDNRPYGIAHERLHELLYPEGHPYRWPVIGYMEDIAAATLEEVRAFFRTYYVPNNVVLTLAGDLDPDAALAEVERYFGPIPRGPEPPPVVLPAGSETVGGARRERVEDDVRLPRVYLAHRVPAYGSTEWYAADLLTTALAAGKSSRLYEDLVYRRQIAQDVAAYVLPTELDATFYVVATCRAGVDPETVEAALAEHLERLAGEALAEPDLERSRNRALVGHYRDLESLERRADRLSELTTYFDDPGLLAHETERYLALAAPELRAFAERHLRPEARVVLTFVPQ